ncbi:hypothetical protein BDV96DRAFT_598918 [Lophiotrema nucula]|uniref:Uncharacterized protein n=1 Tax=Lophiotrema nucula TaxID=690887 RepID=A0A6A5ZCJ8_9PLEO|nr:hypothetical protein BDV96DRAFT_598918 [Lophiotrema nucula]
MARYPSYAARRYHHNARGPALAGDGRAHQTHHRRYYHGGRNGGGDYYRPHPQGRVNAPPAGPRNAGVFNNAHAGRYQGSNFRHQEPIPRTPELSQQASQGIFLTQRSEPIRMLNEPVINEPVVNESQARSEPREPLKDKTNMRKAAHSSSKAKDPIKRMVTNPLLRAVLAGRKIRGPRKPKHGLQLRMGARDHTLFAE